MQLSLHSVTGSTVSLIKGFNKDLLNYLIYSVSHLISDPFMVLGYSLKEVKVRVCVFLPSAPFLRSKLSNKQKPESIYLSGKGMHKAYKMNDHEGSWE